MSGLSVSSYSHLMEAFCQFSGLVQQGILSSFSVFERFLVIFLFFPKSFNAETDSETPGNTELSLFAFIVMIVS